MELTYSEDMDGASLTLLMNVAVILTKYSSAAL